MTKLRQVSLEDKYLLKSDQIFVTGIQALVRLPMMQSDADRLAGVRTAGYVTGYRGSPLGALDQQLALAKPQLEACDIKFLPAVNEDLAATAVWGTQQAGWRGDGLYDGVFSMWYAKGPGVDRSGDPLRHGNLAGTSAHGGVLILMGDDHVCESSTTAHQSEYSLVNTLIPVLNPAGVQDILDFGLYGWALSRYSGCWIGLKSVHDTVEASASVIAGPGRMSLTVPDDFVMPEGGVNFRWPDTPQAQEARLHQFKLPAVSAFLRRNPIDRQVLGDTQGQFGIISTGKSYLDVRRALLELGIDEARAKGLGLKLYKVGMPWPLEPEGLKAFASGTRKLLVVEEKRALMEDQIRSILYGMTNPPEVIGKADESGAVLFQAHGRLDAAQIGRAIGERLLQLTGDETLAGALRRLGDRADDATLKDAAMRRTPYFCAGCPHNTSTQVPDGSRALAGIGCHYMAQWMDRETATFTQMGGEGASWIGEAPFTSTDHVFQNIGDGTYFHSGLLAIRACVGAQVNITYKILYNDAVAMTGGQAIGNNWDVHGITKQLLAEGITKICILSENPAQYKILETKNVISRHRDNIIRAQEDLKKISGVSALIYDQTCAAEKRRRRKRGLLEDPIQRVFINPEICEGCGDCSIQSNCVSIEPLETTHGRKRKINQANCNKDYSCLKGFCPSFITANVIPKKVELTENFEMLDDPQVSQKDVTIIMLTGIGGTGVLTISALLGMAAHIEGKISTTLDLTGLAQKGGAVWSHIKIFSKDKIPFSHKISPASTDLLLACDPIVAAKEEIQETFSKSKTYSVVNASLSPVADFVKERDIAFMEEETIDLIKKSCFELTSLLPASKIAEDLSNDAIGSNLVMLGAAFQAGLIPLKRESIEEAIVLNKVGATNNLYCFNLGRAYVQNPKQPMFRNFLEKNPVESLEQVLSKRQELLQQYGRKELEQYNNSFSKAHELLKNEITAEPVLIRLAKELYRLIAIKDEYQVAKFHIERSTELVNSYGEKYSNLNFYLAPPLLSFIKDQKTQRPKKFKLPSYIALPIFYLLGSLKFLRGSPLDVMKYSKDRKLALKHQEIFFNELNNISHLPEGKRLSSVTNLLLRSEKVKGFGPVRESSFNEFLNSGP